MNKSLNKLLNSIRSIFGQTPKFDKNSQGALEEMSQFIASLELSKVNRFQYIINHQKLIESTSKGHCVQIQWSLPKSINTKEVNQNDFDDYQLTYARSNFSLDRPQVFFIEAVKNQKILFKTNIELNSAESKELVLNMTSLLDEMNKYALEQLILVSRPVELEKSKDLFRIENETRALEWIRVSLEVLDKSFGHIELGRKNSPTSSKGSEELIVNGQLAFERESDGDVQLTYCPMNLIFSIRVEGAGTPSPMSVTAINLAKKGKNTSTQNTSARHIDLEAFFATHTAAVIELVAKSMARSIQTNHPE